MKVSICVVTIENVTLIASLCWGENRWQNVVPNRVRIRCHRLGNGQTIVKRAHPENVVLEKMIMFVKIILHMHK